MADDIIKKRITDSTYAEVTSFANDDVLFIDSPTQGTRKINAKAIVDALNTEIGKALKCSNIYVDANNYSSIITDVNNQPINTIYAYGNGLSSLVANLPSDISCVIIHFSASIMPTRTDKVMLAIERNRDNSSLYFRTTYGQNNVLEWSSWQKVADNIDIETIKEEIDKKINADTFDIFASKSVLNGFIDTNGEYISNASWYIVYKMPTYGATQIKLSGWYSKLTSGSLNNVWAYDADGNSLGGVYEQSESGNIDEIIDLPSGTAYVSVCNTVSKRQSPGYIAYLMPICGVFETIDNNFIKLFRSIGQKNIIEYNNKLYQGIFDKLNFEQGYITIENGDVDSQIYVRSVGYINDTLLVHDEEKKWRKYAVFYNEDSETPQGYYDFSTGQIVKTSVYSTEEYIIIPHIDGKRYRLRYRLDSQIGILFLKDLDLKHYSEVLESVSKSMRINEQSLPLDTFHGKTVKILDAIDNCYAISIPSNSEIRSINMFPINAINRTTNGITFTVDSNDNNTVNINGTATSNAYSYGTITENNSVFLKVGTYYLKSFGSSNQDIRLYIDIFTNGVHSTKSKPITAIANGWSFELEADSYVGCRIQIPKWSTIQDETVSIMFSGLRIEKLQPYDAYFPPRNDGLLRRRCVVLNENESDSVTYVRDSTLKKPIRLKIGTFNVGDYSGNGGNIGDVDEPTGDKLEYIRYISSLNADILCTQEDREYWKISTEESIFDEIYSNMYSHSILVSKALSHGNTMAKAIYSWYDSVLEGKYTFENQGTYESSGGNFWNSLTYAVLKIDAYYVLIVSVHLAPKSNNTEVRKLEIAEMLSLIEQIGVDRVIICGDFNVWEDEYDSFGPEWKLANCGAYGTYATYDSTNIHPYDNIIVSNGLTVSNVEIHNNNSFKDHFAVTATVTII